MTERDTPAAEPRAGRAAARNRPALRQAHGPAGGDAGHSGRAHGGGDRPRRRRQVEPAVHRRRRPRAAAGPRAGAGRRHGQRRPPPAGLPAHRLHAAGAGQEPLPDPVGVREHRLLRPPVRPRPRRMPAPHRHLDRGDRARALSGAAGRQALGRHEAEARPLLRADPRSRPADPRRADHRRRSPVAPAVLAVDRGDPDRTPADERAGRHGLHGGGRRLRLAGGDGGRSGTGHRDARGAAGAHRQREPGGRLHRPAAGRTARPLPPGGDRAAARVRGRPRHRHRGAGPDQALRRLHGGRPRQLPHPARRDLRLPRLQRLRQDDDDEDADRPVAAERGGGPGCSGRRSTRATSPPAGGSATCPRPSRSTPS